MSVKLSTQMCQADELLIYIQNYTQQRKQECNREDKNTAKQARTQQKKNVNFWARGQMNTQ